MGEQNKKEILAEEQKSIFEQYLRMAGISNSSADAQEILGAIESGRISTFSLHDVVRIDGEHVPIVTVAIMESRAEQSGFMKPVTFMEMADLVSLAALGFREAININRGATRDDTNAVLVGRGLSE